MHVAGICPMPTQTQTGTLLLGGIEYNEYPPPPQLVKLMTRERADEVIQNGLLRLRPLQYYRHWENKVLGDPNDGLGLYHLDGHPIHAGSINPDYAWCLSLPEIDLSRRLLLARHGGYDSIVWIHAPEEFFRRVRDWLSAHLNGFHLHCGCVNYDRGGEVDKQTLNSQKFLFHVFQKDPKFQEDMEYRMAVTDATFTGTEQDHLDLALGDCTDIISIEDLPDSA
jgi:hypothetical protein